MKQARPSPFLFSRILTPLAFLAGCAVLAYASAVDASRPAGWTAAGQTAVVDVAKVFEEIEERTNWDIRIENMRASIETEARSRSQAMERRLKESESVTDADARQKMRDEVALMQLRLEQWGNAKTREVDREEALKWRSIYRNLMRETKRVAEAEGIDIVLVDDSGSEIRTENNAQVPLQAQVIQQITTRRVLFAKNAIDITDQVIIRMNNAVEAP